MKFVLVVLAVPFAMIGASALIWARSDIQVTLAVAGLGFVAVMIAEVAILMRLERLAERIDRADDTRRG